jgi:hypothetical protein
VAAAGAGRTTTFAARLAGVTPALQRLEKRRVWREAHLQAVQAQGVTCAGCLVSLLHDR